MVIDKDFNFDVEQEKILQKTVMNDFLEGYLEKNFGAKSRFIDFDEDSNLQFRGVDIITDIGEKQFLIDLKAQTNNYIGIKTDKNTGPTNTFCLELSAVSKGKIRTGWFLNPSIMTTHYMFMWIHDSNAKRIYYTDYAGKKKSRLYIEKPEDATEYNLMIINVRKTHEWLSKHGCTDEVCKVLNDYIRKHNVDRIYFNLKTGKTSFEKPKHKDYVTFVKTKFKEKEECPVNLVVSNRFWRQIADSEYTISNGNVVEKRKAA